MATVMIGNKQYDSAYANDPKNQEEIRNAVVNGGNNIYNSSDKGLIHNTTGNTINTNSTGGMVSTGSTYTNDKGNDVTPYSERNNIGTVLGGTIFDPNSSNFNSLIANSGGKINLANVGDYNSQGIFTGANSGSKSESDSQAYYAKVLNGGSNPISGSLSGGGSSSLGGGSSGYNASSGGYNPVADMNSLKEFQKQAAMADLGKARDSSLSNLAADKANIAPQYYADREKTSTASQLGAKNFAEFMAARGQTNAGVAGQSELNRGNQLQGDIGRLNVAEQGAFDTNARSVTNLNNAYNSDVASSNAGIEATGMQNLITAQTQQRAEQLAQANADRAYNYQVSRDAVGDTNYNNQFQYNQSRDTINDTGQLANGQQTLTGQQSAAQIAASNANTAGQLIQNTYASQIAQGQIDAQGASTAYQMLVNEGYPKEQALKLGGMLASYNGQNLDNNAKALANKYAPAIAQGQIDGQKLQNSYQSLVNGGYKADQAADIALKYAQIGLTNANAFSTSQESYDDFSNNYGGGEIIAGGSVPSQYAGWVNDAAKKSGIDPSILAGLIQTESSWNPNAVNSKSGATGLGQFLASTAKDEGLTNPKDAKSNIYATAEYLAKRISWAGGDVNKGIMGYGEGTTEYLNKVLNASKSLAKTNTDSKANVKRTAADVDTIVADKTSDVGYKTNLLQNMLQYYSAQPAGTQTDYMIRYINNGMQTVNKKDMI